MRFLQVREFCSARGESVVRPSGPRPPLPRARLFVPASKLHSRVIISMSIHPDGDDGEYYYNGDYSY